MPENLKKEDLRILKTHRALMSAMSKLLELRNFNQITVHDLCGEALISRANFYSHYNDKYDFLKHWLTNSKSTIMFKSDAYEDYEEIINDQVNCNFKKIKNLIENVNSETYELMCDFISLLLDINTDEEIDQKYIVLSKFCSGGIMNYLTWFVKNKSPTDFSLMNPYCYYILMDLKKWNEDRECSRSINFAEKGKQRKPLGSASMREAGAVSPVTKRSAAPIDSFDH